MSATWVFDWAKIKSVEDVVQLLKACELHPRPDHIDFEHLKPFCKLIDDDGREILPSKSERYAGSDHAEQ